ncbi:transcriptional regulator with XRE-family HTH domain [Kitasatospora sp. MAP12-15]|uniref:helix-turn-helix domain-containing protein n=1 Tax=unclassified Kitasatospora TaxID=2633591 RepID=UPI0024758553|nr:transcriptional regulator [Kitasatospora sp. MAP12-44]MDH6109700.1 transcriptional regulator with XRE-family HTH domain [Kitasatospora sp. MAP12-44]
MSTSEERRAFGSHIAELRKQRGLKQEELAAVIGRTASWLSQVERGVQPVNRLDVLRLLADGLCVSLETLRPDASALAPLPAAPPKANDLDQARLVLSGHPAPELLLAGHPTGASIDLPELRAAVDRLWGLTHGNKFAELSASLSQLVPGLERAARTVPPAQAPEIWLLLSRAYQALSAAFARQDEPDASWLAADRAIRAAEQAGYPMEAFAGIFRLAHAFVRLKRLDQAEHTATTAIAALQNHATSDPEHLSLLGSLHLVLALVHARAGDRSRARAEMERARAVGRQLGEDRQDFDLEFGPTNVEIQAVSIAVELGDAGEAIDIGAQIDASTLSVERQARLLMDLGRAYAQRRQSTEALACLLKAEELAPEAVHSHTAARNAIRELLLIAGRKAPQELKALAERASAQP